MILRHVSQLILRNRQFIPGWHLFFVLEFNVNNITREREIICKLFICLSLWNIIPTPCLVRTVVTRIIEYSVHGCTFARSWPWISLSPKLLAIHVPIFKAIPLLLFVWQGFRRLTTWESFWVSSSAGSWLQCTTNLLRVHDDFTRDICRDSSHPFLSTSLCRWLLVVFLPPSGSTPRQKGAVYPSVAVDKLEQDRLLLRSLGRLTEKTLSNLWVVGLPHTYASEHSLLFLNVQETGYQFLGSWEFF